MSEVQGDTEGGLTPINTSSPVPNKNKNFLGRMPQEVLDNIFSRLSISPDGEHLCARKVLICPRASRCNKHRFISVLGSPLRDIAATSRGMRRQMDVIALKSRGAVVSIAAQHCQQQFIYSDVGKGQDPEGPLPRTLNQDLVKHVKLDYHVYCVLIRHFIHERDGGNFTVGTSVLAQMTRLVQTCVSAFRNADTLTVTHKGGAAYYRMKTQVRNFAKLASLFPHIRRFVVDFHHCTEGLVDGCGCSCPHRNPQNPDDWAAPVGASVWELHARHSLCGKLRREFATLMGTVSRPYRLNLVEAPEPYQGNPLLCRAVFERA